MLNNYLKIAFRNLKNSKVYTLINILGLTLSIACVFLIFTLVKYHLSFDTFHTNAERIYRITTELHTEEISYNPGIPSPLGEAFRNDYTFAEKVARVASFPIRLVSVRTSESNKKFEENIAFAEPAFFEILDFPLMQGNQLSILNEPNTAIITKRLAEKYFGEEDPIGKTIQIDDKLEVTINGILEGIPANTVRKAEIYLSFDNLKAHSPWLVEEDWWLSVNKAMQCFVSLKPGVSPATVNKALTDISAKYYNEKNADIFQFKLQHISDIHFNTNLDGDIEKKDLWILSIVGLFLIITACVNFINLATAQALDRSKGIGIRKVMGSARRQVFWQFISETALVSIFAMAIAVAIAYFSLPYVNQLFKTQLKLSHYYDVHLLVFLPLLLLTIVFLSGSYPGVVLANCQPVLALKSKLFHRSTGLHSARKGLIITQFVISQILIICSIVIANQMRYAKRADMGFQKDAIVMLPVPDNEKSKISTLGAQLGQIAGVENATFCNAAPASDLNPTTGIHLGSRAESEKFSITLRAGDNQYVSTFGLQILEGRNLKSSDTVREYLINELAVKKLGIEDYGKVIGKNATINGKKGAIVGVVKDFHNNSFHASIDPVYLTTLSDNYGSCAVKINVKSLTPVLAKLEKAWREIYPNDIYKYDFLDERIARFYEADNVMLKLIQVFTSIAIVIGCLGLYGLILFISTQKTKEIGIRKVNGAKVWEVMIQLNKDFIKWIILAFIVAIPIAWYAMQRWLENFAYKTELSWWIFALAGILALTIALLTVSWQSWKAATRNPVEALRYE